ncbi:MAG: RNA polymerase sigma factor [Bacteroidota bacterium]
MTANDSDITLIEAARGGDRTAFSSIVQRYEGKVGATIVGMLGNVPEADDVAQEVFIRFYKSLHKFEGRSQLGTYLTRIAINQCLSHLEKKKRKRWFSRGKSEDESLLLNIPDGGLSAAEKDTQAAVQSALLKLEPDFRSVVVLRMLEGYSTEETAKLLGLPKGTVLSRLARGQKKLRTIMEKMGLSVVGQRS